MLDQLLRRGGRLWGLKADDEPAAAETSAVLVQQRWQQLLAAVMHQLHLA